jgi:hypothetical protein
VRGGGLSPVFATGTVTTTNQITGCGYIILHITGIFSDVTSCLNQVVDQIYGPGRFSVCNVVPSSPTAGSVGLFNGTCGGPNFYNNSLGPISCPANSSGTSTCTCNINYTPDPTGTSCVPVPVVTCVAPSVPDGAGGCACNPPNRINSIGECTACPVDPLTTPPFNDACANVLENIHSTRAQKDAACGVLTDNLKAGMACFSDKLSRTNDIVTGNPIPFVVTSDIRDIAYQAHFREIWDKMQLLVKLMKDDPAMQTACAARRAEIAAEKGCDNAGVCKSCYSESATQRSHCLKGMPADPNPNDAQHTQGNAFDVSATYTIAPLRVALGALRPPQNIPLFLDAPTNCGLIWGGMFITNKDPVHFLAR